MGQYNVTMDTGGKGFVKLIVQAKVCNTSTQKWAMSIAVHQMLVLGKFVISWCMTLQHDRQKFNVLENYYFKRSFTLVIGATNLISKSQGFIVLHNSSEFWYDPPYSTEWIDVCTVPLIGNVALARNFSLSKMTTRQSNEWVEW